MKTVDQRVEDYANLAWAEARKNTGLDFHVALSCALDSLWKAAQTYDESSSQFGTWATNKIRFGLLDECRRQGIGNQPVKKVIHAFSIDAATGDEKSILETYPADKTSSPDWLIKSFELTSYVNKLLFALNEKQRTVLTLRYGLSGEEPKKLDEISEMMNLTKARIHQIENKALLILRRLVNLETL